MVSLSLVSLELLIGWVSQGILKCRQIVETLMRGGGCWLGQGCKLACVSLSIKSSGYNASWRSKQPGYRGGGRALQAPRPRGAVLRWYREYYDYAAGGGPAPLEASHGLHGAPSKPPSYVHSSSLQAAAASPLSVRRSSSNVIDVDKEEQKEEKPGGKSAREATVVC